MARSATVRTIPARNPPPVPPRRPLLTLVRGLAHETDVDPRQPTVGVHRRVIAFAMLGVLVFLLAIPFFLSNDPLANFNLLGVAGFAVIFFTLTLGLADRASHQKRWGGADKESFDEFLHDNVSTATGTVSSREAMIQILTLPAVLGLGMWAIALVFAFSK